MPFANCQRCGRLFHLFDPILPEAQASYWPNLNQGDGVREFCPECLAVLRDHDPDPNVNAARIVAESAGDKIGPQRASPASVAKIQAQAKQAAAELGATSDLEAAWQAWSAGIQKVDERGMTLLRAAFEAGFDAARASE